MMRAAPGLALAGIGVAISLGAHQAVAGLPPLVLCVALGVAVANLARVPEAADPGLRIAAGPLLKLGVVLLGIDLVFPDILALGLRALLVVVAVVAVTFFGTRWIGRRLGVSDDLSLLVATGFSICGVSAIAAANSVIDADEDEVAFSVGLVTLCGTIAIVTLPPLQGVLRLDDEQFGAWVGASVHDVAQVVATSSTAGSVALATAIVVKLTRVMLLAPLIAGIALRHRSQPRHRRAPGPHSFPPSSWRSSSWSGSRASASSPIARLPGSTTSAPSSSAWLSSRSEHASTAAASRRSAHVRLPSGSFPGC